MQVQSQLGISKLLKPPRQQSTRIGTKAQQRFASFLNALRSPNWHSLETAPGGINLGLGSTLASSPTFCSRCAILGDVVPNYGAGSALENAGLPLSGKCFRHRSEKDR
jgi:hypothetical protein